MTRKTKRTITMTVSLILVLALGGIYFWQQRIEEEPVVTPPPVFTFEHLIMRSAQDVESVTFVHADGQSYTMRPLGMVMHPTMNFEVMAWEHTGYPDFILNQEIARGKTNMAWGVTSSDTVHECASGINLADFGLDPPQLTLHVTYTDNTRKNVYIGLQTPDRMGYFVMVSDNPGLFRMVNAPVDRAKVTLADMVCRSTPAIDMNAIHIRIAQPGVPEIELVLPPYLIEDILEGTFVLQQPLGHHLEMAQPLEDWEVMADSLDVHMIRRMENFRVGPPVNLAPACLSPYGLDNPSMEFFFANFMEEAHLLFGDVFMYNNVPHIYVKFYDRPHVFKAVYSSMNVLFDFDIFRIINRIIALIPIDEVERVTVITQDPARNVELIMDHSDVPELERNTTINGVRVPERRQFNTAYRLLISISGESEIAPHMPRGQPDIVITYYKLEGPPTELRLFAVDNNFYTVSKNGEEAWLLTSRRGMDIFFNFVNTLLP